MTLASLLLQISALGIFIHSFFLSISLGFPWVIGALLYKWWRTNESEYFDAARTTTGVLGLNFALGAITGTLVEFGLVQAWPGSIFAIATFGLVPLTLELVAFLGEIVLLVMFIVTLGKARPFTSLSIITVYAAMAALSGVLITTVNSWLNVPWGTGSLASHLYPFLPTYGPAAVNAPSIVTLKLELVKNVSTTGTGAQILQNPSVARTIGVALTDPLVAFGSPYAWASAFHNVNAGIIVGICFGLVGYAYRFLKAGEVRYVKILRAFLPVLLILLILQPTLFGDFMGKMVAAQQPTKFALMEGSVRTTQNPLVAFLAYGDPTHPIIGFDTLRDQCNSLGNATLGNLSALSPNVTLGALSGVSLKSTCQSDLAKAESRLALINGLYYVKISFGVVDLAGIIGLVALNFSIPVLSKITKKILHRFSDQKRIFLLSLLTVIASILASGIGWFIREDGRKPWTVYGLLYPEELITPVPVGATLVFFTALFVAVAAIGIYGIYIVSTRRLKFIELLKKGGGVE